MVVLAILYFAVSSDTINVDTKHADYEARIVFKYTDGSEATVKKFKTASAYHDDKPVKEIAFHLDVRFKPQDDGTTRVLSPRNDPDHMTRVEIVFEDNIGTTMEVADHPLSGYTSDDYIVLEEGEWYHLFKDITITTLELEQRVGSGLVSMSWTLRWKVTVWYNVDVDKSEAARHEITFSVPMRIVQISGPGAYDGDGGPVQRDPTKETPPSGEPFVWNPSTDPVVPSKPEVKKVQYEATEIPKVPWNTGSGSGSEATIPNEQWRR